MENKNLLEMLNELNEVLDELKDDINDGFKAKFKDYIKKAFKEPAEISIKKDVNGNAETHIEGSNLSILITLAGLEKTVLKKLDIPNSVWNKIKLMVGTREAGDNE